MKPTKWFPGMLSAAAALYLLRGWGTRWGAAPAETRQPLPGDEIVPHPDLETTHAITIDAAPEAVWPWLVQLRYYRGGWFTDSTWRDWDYYPDKVLRFFVRQEAEKSGVGHRDVPSADRVLPEFQNLKAVDVILDGPPGTAFFTVAAIEPEEHLILHSDTHHGVQKENDKAKIENQASAERDPHHIRYIGRAALPGSTGRDGCLYRASGERSGGQSPRVF